MCFYLCTYFLAIQVCVKKCFNSQNICNHYSAFNKICITFGKQQFKIFSQLCIVKEVIINQHLIFSPEIMQFLELLVVIQLLWGK